MMIYSPIIKEIQKIQKEKDNGIEEKIRKSIIETLRNKVKEETHCSSKKHIVPHIIPEEND